MRVPPHFVLRFLLLFYSLLLLAAANENNSSEIENCPNSFACGDFGDVHFPFSNTMSHECGLPIMNCNDLEAVREVQLGNQKWFQIENIYQQEDRSQINILDHDLQNLLSSKNCSAFFYKLTMPSLSPMMSFNILDTITIFRCIHNSTVPLPQNYSKYTNCSEYDIYFDPLRTDDVIPSSLSACSTIQLPFKTQSPDPISTVSDPYTFLTAQMHIEVELSKTCHDCYYKREGWCRLEGKLCSIDDTAPTQHKRGVLKPIKIGLIMGLGCGGVILIGYLFIILRKQEVFNYSGLGVPVFSYEELEKATNNFDPSSELGRGGFGRVYYGKLEDGREVAIKRLHERKRDYKHIKQFMNEIKLLTCLRHGNLVSLYGCTAPQSRELMLVYEYIPNGTVGDYLHGHLAEPGSLPWSVRLKIAIETAIALTYLHAFDIIHRDVKTNNILLDNNFSAILADFGISRWFPHDASHVSTAPQGTLGYLDPQYQQSHHLTKKSDVYSFGVVLIELISSLTVVDETRDVGEVNLANLAIKIIKRRAFTELVDPSLGFESNENVKRMIISVAELAFKCLQKDKKLRPSMFKVLEVLQIIESRKGRPEHLGTHGVGISCRDIHIPSLTSLDLVGVASLKNLTPKRPHQTI
ncbi:LEAF RUST 10 DISEASE-RESISTANCE LOCUS RECEPTOR-LIKE PROTEIN KINASE-like 1.1 isoform X3 [Senna tora]|uniref:LEAF RUST 10 DISEASE-RESISTANCE LOCUS RECEPTOR-LIKE PROTEIN KINASE-like 1.1 isoform X3 n=1 Tax=Senna tora TaxID=362788 RepID=A0A834SS30_9FABA|nr:LEAF RUST 10 DISEASE-RESISTANCE LOCUS RECEPTOR-LIKE PROTEIN KINASE-like 1.1 isoform X3 [Senna tora]